MPVLKVALQLMLSEKMRRDGSLGVLDVARYIKGPAAQFAVDLMPPPAPGERNLIPRNLHGISTAPV
jgi:hypothetical protein